MIFKSVRYFLPHSLTAERRDELTKILNANGGEEAARLDVATHVITNSHVFEGYQNVSENVAVVTDFWVDRSVVLGKVQNVRIYSADPVKIFSGVTACTSEIATSDQEIIAAGLNGLGGLYREGFTRDCTHLIVPRPGSTKYDTGIQLKSTMQMRVVVPQWFDDCFQQMLHLPEEPYEWPDPEILRSSNVGGDPAKKKSVIPKPRRDLIRTALETLPEGDEKIRIEKLTAKSIPNVWAGRRILLSRNLDVEHVMDFVKTSIKRGGGVLIDLDWSQDEDDLEEEELAKVSDADIYVTQYRAGRAYLKALKENKTIGSLAWLFHVQQTGTIVRPEDHLLHYPRRNQKIPNFDTHVMTISNYSDDARAYLKRLIVLMGGEFTADMNQRNTIVVAAYISGKKTEKAREWDIPIVNHTWLEDCFVAWRALTPAQEKYITFPQGLSFAKLVAQRGVGRIGFDVASPAEIAAIEAEVELEIEARRKRRGDGGGASEEVVIKEEKDVKTKKKGGEPAKATEASQNEAREVEVLMDLDEVPPADDFPVQEIDTDHADDEVEEEEKDVRKRSPSPLSSLPVSPVKKKRGKPKEAQLVSEDEDEEESQPRTVSKTNNKSSAAGPSKKVKKAAQSETEAELEEVSPPRRPEPPKKKAGSSKATRSRARSDPESEDDGEIEEVERPAAKQAKPANPVAKSTTTEKSKSKGKFKEKNATSSKRADSDVIDLSDDNEEEEEPESEPYPTRRQTRSLTSSPTKNAATAPVSKVPTTSFYGSSPKKPLTAAAPSPKKVASPKTKKTTAKASTSSRMEEMMQELESSDSDADLQFSPVKSTNKGKGKATAPTKKPAAARALARTDDEEEEEEGKASANASRDEEQVRKKRESHPVTRIGPPKAKTKNGPLATSTPLRKAPRRNENTDESSPTHGLVVEVEIESQESPPVAGPSRIRGGATTKVTAVAAEMISASPERARPSKKRPRSPSPPPAPNSRPSSPNKQRKNATVAKSQTPSSLSERDQLQAQVNGVGGRPPGRQAKALAAAKLKDDVSDANSYAKEIKSGRIRGAWERELPKENNSKGKGKATAANSPAVVKRRASAASSVKETEDDEEGGDETGKSSKSKKRKVPEDEDSKGGKKKARFKEREESMSVGAATTENDERTPGKGIKFMTTGVQLDQKVVDGLDKLGIKETKVPRQCTHLIVKSIMRTEKFLFALANAPCIVSKDWALDCARAKRVLPTDKYLLHDPEGEAKHGLNLEKTLERARFQKGKLFLHHVFYLTPNIPNYSTVKKVIQAHSGKPSDCKKTVKVEELKKDKDCRHVISCQEDRAIWEPLAKQGYPIFSAEAVYKAVFRQETNWSDETVQVQVGM
ncbi:hypothetical protein SCHPADRAFT_901651 [Schizopora paradoxa]|uniref:BRCT domain-containing protein n=1 Tax=Schizopora paradoxa TaxID=27342 RepID=A0A0H2SGN9_9AGAM|nr:hypothetical protein SCHPADRAFT_901651 [Schizopora paradoxa]